MNEWQLPYSSENMVIEPILITFDMHILEVLIGYYVSYVLTSYL